MIVHPKGDSVAPGTPKELNTFSKTCSVYNPEIKKKSNDTYRGFLHKIEKKKKKIWLCPSLFLNLEQHLQPDSKGFPSNYW